jgi:hypothetical protein
VMSAQVRALGNRMRPRGSKSGTGVRPSAARFFYSETWRRRGAWGLLDFGETVEVRLRFKGGQKPTLSEIPA